jgi:hypothetical protein
MMGHGCRYLNEPSSARRRAQVQHFLMAALTRAGVRDSEPTVERAAGVVERALGRLTAR